MTTKETYRVELKPITTNYEIVIAEEHLELVNKFFKSWEELTRKYADDYDCYYSYSNPTVQFEDPKIAAKYCNALARWIGEYAQYKEYKYEFTEEEAQLIEDIKGCDAFIGLDEDLLLVQDSWSWVGDDREESNGHFSGYAHPDNFPILDGEVKKFFESLHSDKFGQEIVKIGGEIALQNSKLQEALEL